MFNCLISGSVEILNENWFFREIQSSSFVLINFSKRGLFDESQSNEPYASVIFPSVTMAFSTCRNLSFLPGYKVSLVIN